MAWLRSVVTGLPRVVPMHRDCKLMTLRIGPGRFLARLCLRLHTPRSDGCGGVWVFRTVCFERVVLSSPGCLWPGRMDDHEEVLEAHA